MGRLDRTQVIRALINEMFKIAGHSVVYEDLLNRTDEWYLQYTMTPEQNKQWREWGEGFIKHYLRTTKKQAQVEMAMINLNYGLKIIEQ